MSVLQELLLLEKIERLEHEISCKDTEIEDLKELVRSREKAMDYDDEEFERIIRIKNAEIEALEFRLEINADVQALAEDLDNADAALDTIRRVIDDYGY